MNSLYSPQNLGELMRYQCRRLEEAGEGALQVNHTKGFDLASATICRYQSTLYYKYRKTRKIVYSLTSIKWPPSGRSEGVGRLAELKTPETVLVGT